MPQPERLRCFVIDEKYTWSPNGESRRCICGQQDNSDRFLRQHSPVDKETPDRAGCVEMLRCIGTDVARSRRASLTLNAIVLVADEALHAAKSAEEVCSRGDSFHRPPVFRLQAFRRRVVCLRTIRLMVSRRSG